MVAGLRLRLDYIDNPEFAHGMVRPKSKMPLAEQNIFHWSAGRIAHGIITDLSGVAVRRVMCSMTTRGLRRVRVARYADAFSESAASYPAGLGMAELFLQIREGYFFACIHLFHSAGQFAFRGG